MSKWIRGIILLAGFAAASYIWVSPDIKGVLVGMLVGVIVNVFIELLVIDGKSVKLLDLSAIIDGRIIEICHTNFVTGTLIIPQFLMDELKRMTDSKDHSEASKGKRGLEVVAQLRESDSVEVRIITKNPKKVTKHIDKLVDIAYRLKAGIITTNFSLYKAAVLKDVVVLNITDLASALKPVALPGETMTVYMMKEGKEKDQGIAYLDDGTMIVAEEGRKHIGKRTDVTVTSIRQTPTGRMVFVKIKKEKSNFEFVSDDADDFMRGAARSERYY